MLAGVGIGGLEWVGGLTWRRGVGSWGETDLYYRCFLSHVLCVCVCGFRDFCGGLVV